MSRESLVTFCTSGWGSIWVKYVEHYPAFLKNTVYQYNNNKIKSRDSARSTKEKIKTYKIIDYSYGKRCGWFVAFRHLCCSFPEISAFSKHEKGQRPTSGKVKVKWSSQNSLVFGKLTDFEAEIEFP